MGERCQDEAFDLSDRILGVPTASNWIDTLPIYLNLTDAPKKVIFLIDLPTNDLMGEKDPLHLWVLDVITSFIFDNLFGGSIDEPDIKILFLANPYNMNM